MTEHEFVWSMRLYQLSLTSEFIGRDFADMVLEIRRQAIQLAGLR